MKEVREQVERKNKKLKKAAEAEGNLNSFEAGKEAKARRETALRQIELEKMKENEKEESPSTRLQQHLKESKRKRLGETEAEPNMKKQKKDEEGEEETEDSEDPNAEIDALLADAEAASAVEASEEEKEEDEEEDETGEEPEVESNDASEQEEECEEEEAEEDHEVDSDVSESGSGGEESAGGSVPCSEAGDGAKNAENAAALGTNLQTAAGQAEQVVVANSTTHKKEWDTFSRLCANRAKFPTELSQHLRKSKLDLFNVWLQSGKQLDERLDRKRAAFQLIQISDIDSIRHVMSGSSTPGWC